MTYDPPFDSIRFALKNVLSVNTLDAHLAGLTEDLVDAVLMQAGKLAAEIWAPLNHSGDQEGARLVNGVVTPPKGFAEAYRLYAEGGWAGLASDVEWGGQGLPMLLEMALAEIWAGANMALSLCPMLSRGAIAALSAHGSLEQKALYLPKLIAGTWTSTMNLTEPQAGSDVGALRTRAEPVGDGTYRISGTKIFITWGEHNMTENIVHLVLARLPGAASGTKGISLFLVPKFLVNPDGSLGAHNDVRCIGIERKLGIRGSPTCVMSFGENGGAIGTLIGAENRGMAAMFTMMNDARLNVGVQGLGVAEAATQKALSYATERRQGRLSGQGSEESVAIVAHPDVQRMLVTMRAQTEVARALCYATAIAIDMSRVGSDDTLRRAARARADLLTPIAKAWSTEIGLEVASLGLQVHGGMGFIEETGAAQFYRDARIAPIYEGTNGIQAIDLVTRKLSLEDGHAVATFLAEMEETATMLSTNPALAEAASVLAHSVEALRSASNWLTARLHESPDDVLAGATPFLAFFGTVAGGHYLGRGALSGCPSRIALMRFYVRNILSSAQGLAMAVVSGADVLQELGLADASERLTISI